MSKRRTIHKHLVNMDLLIEPKEKPISFIEWIALRSDQRYRLRKHYLKYNISIPTP